MIDTSKVIHAPVGGGRYTVTAPIVKEDYGLYLKIEGLELPQTYEVDFSNSEHNGTSVTMIGNSDGVLIPSQFIASGKDVFAFLYHVGEDYGRTIFKFRIPNKLRPDRTDDVPTPEEQSTIDQAISALNSAVEQTAQDVIDADASAQFAQGYAESAEGYAESASTSASNALASETNAERYADRAETAESHAQDYASQASGSASSADDSAETAEAYATGKRDGVDVGSSDPTYHNNSKYYSEQASASATTASTKAGEASESASTASSKATEASGYASTASTKAGEASTSAQTASTKASEASGYATTASNKAIEASGYATSASQAKTDAESARDLAQGYASDAQGYANDAQASAESISASASQIAQNTADIASLEEDIYKPYVVDSASGSIASFSDGADDIPLKSLVVNIDPVQDLSNGDPSPENICPISGWTGMEIQHTKKNLLPLNVWSGISYNASVGTVFEPALTDNSWTQEEDRISYATTSMHTTLSLMSPLLPKGTYRLSVHKISSGALRYTQYALDKGYTVKSKDYSSNVSVNSATLTLDEDGYVAVRLDNGRTASQTVEITIQLEVGDTETAYEPYNGTTIPISWQSEAGTVYGGKLDVLSGILTVYPYYASYNGETLIGEWISDRDVYAVGTTPTIGAQVVNIGAEGTEYQLEPHEVKSLLGANNIFADTVDTSVEYRADAKLYIEKLTQPEEDDMVADSAITSGQFFMIGNTLYRALANIASGATITVGTNAQRVSLSDALNLVNT